MDAKTGKPLVDVIVDAAGQKGTGLWTAKGRPGPRFPVSPSQGPFSPAPCPPSIVSSASGLNAPSCPPA